MVLRITPGDDRPLHQHPRLLSETDLDRNFYERYYFQGYPSNAVERSELDGFFAFGISVYPTLGIIDAAFSIVDGDTQHSLLASRKLDDFNREDLSVGPFSVKIVEPLKRFSITIAPQDGISGELHFTATNEPHAEDPQQIRAGPRTVMNSQRFTQAGTWDGNISLQGKDRPISSTLYKAVRDRSWGIRNVGERDLQPNLWQAIPEFFWLWAPTHLSDGGFAHTYSTEVPDPAEPQRALIIQTQDGAKVTVPSHQVELELDYHPNTRRIRHCRFYSEEQDAEFLIQTTPQLFFMRGLGYLHPTHGFAIYHGDESTHYESYDLSGGADNLSESDISWLHVQALAQVTVRVGSEQRSGVTALEQLILGPHSKSGLTSLIGSD